MTATARSSLQSTDATIASDGALLDRRRQAGAHLLAAVPRPEPVPVGMSVVRPSVRADGSLYTGIAKDLPRRLAQHATGRASRYTRGRLPVTLVWSRRVRSWRDALRTEARIKALRRREKDALVQDERRCRCAGAIADALPAGDPAARHPVRRAREDTERHLLAAGADRAGDSWTRSRRSG